MTVTGTETAAKTTVDATAPAVDLKAELLRIVLEQGLPTDTSKSGLIAYGIGLLLALAIMFVGWKFGKTNPYAVFAVDVLNAVNRVYLEKIKPYMAEHDGNKPGGEKLREWAYLFLAEAKGPTAKIIAEKGKPWVMAQIHRIANKVTGKQN